MAEAVQNSTDPSAIRVYAAAAAADAFARRLLAAHGVPDQDAAVIASCLINADLRGYAPPLFLYSDSPC